MSAKITTTDPIEMQLRKELREARAERNEAVMLLKEALPFIGYLSTGNEERKQRIEGFLAALPWVMPE